MKDVTKGFVASCNTAVRKWVAEPCRAGLIIPWRGGECPLLFPGMRTNVLPSTYSVYATPASRFRRVWTLPPFWIYMSRRDTSENRVNSNNTYDWQGSNCLDILYVSKGGIWLSLTGMRFPHSIACVFGAMLNVRPWFSSRTIFTRGVGRVGIVKDSPSSPSFQLQRIREMVYSRTQRSTTSRNETKRKRLHMVEPCIHEFDGWRDQGHIFTVRSSSNVNRVT